MTYFTLLPGVVNQKLYEKLLLHKKGIGLARSRQCVAYAVGILPVSLEHAVCFPGLVSGGCVFAWGLFLPLPAALQLQPWKALPKRSRPEGKRGWELFQSVLQLHVCDLEERLTPASSNTREKGKYEHMFSTCQTVALSNCVFRKEKKPKLSNANKEQYNSFDLLCSSLHQLFQFLEMKSFFENAKSLFQEYKILQVSISVFIQRSIGQTCQIFRTAKEKKKVFK